MVSKITAKIPKSAPFCNILETSGLATQDAPVHIMYSTAGTCFWLVHLNIRRACRMPGPLLGAEHPTKTNFLSSVPSPCVKCYTVWHIFLALLLWAFLSLFSIKTSTFYWGKKKKKNQLKWRLNQSQQLTPLNSTCFPLLKAKHSDSAETELMN